MKIRHLCTNMVSDSLEIKVVDCWKTIKKLTGFPKSQVVVLKRRVTYVVRTRGIQKWPLGGYKSSNVSQYTIIIIEQQFNNVIQFYVMMDACVNKAYISNKYYIMSLLIVFDIYIIYVKYLNMSTRSFMCSYCL